MCKMKEVIIKKFKILIWYDCPQVIKVHTKCGMDILAVATLDYKNMKFPMVACTITKGLYKEFVKSKIDYKYLFSKADDTFIIDFFAKDSKLVLYTPDSEIVSNKDYWPW